MALADLLQGSLWRTPPIFDAPGRPSGMTPPYIPGQPQEPSPTPQPRWMQSLNSPLSQIGMRLLANSRDQRGNPTPIGQALGNSVLGYQQQVQSQQEEDLRRKYMEAQIARMQQPEQTQEPAQIQLLRALQKDPALLEMYQKMNPTGTTQDAAAIQEYRLAQTTGFKGSYMDFIRSKNAPQREPLIAIQTPDGRSVLVPQSQAAGATPAAPRENFVPTEGERTSGNYLGRMQAAEKLLGGYQPGMMDYVAADRMMRGGTVGGSMANMAISPKGQEYYQAAADWVRAKLRKESGAVISPEEMSQEIKTYFPMPGDSKATIAQKAKARQQAMEGMKGMAGRAVPAAPAAASPDDPLGIR